MDWIVYCGGLVFAFYLIAFFASLRKNVPAELKAKKLTTKPASQATVKPQATVKSQAPTEEELMAMSDSELLRKIAMHSERTDNHLSHIRLLIWVIILGFIGLLSP